MNLVWNIAANIAFQSFQLVDQKWFYSNEAHFLLLTLCFQGQYTKITFRSPLYVGGSPNAYWLVRATGTNRGFLGCIQSLTVNNKAIDIRPWPLGRALSGADIGEEAYYQQYMILTHVTHNALVFILDIDAQTSSLGATLERETTHFGLG